MRAGDAVKLRSPAEILQTLDEHGCLEGVPFMPEMLAFFEKAFRVTARVERACDTVHYRGVVKLRNTVILEDLRCDGRGHSGCGAQCRLYWKEAWLRPASEPADHTSPNAVSALAKLEQLTTRSVVRRESAADHTVFRCQATELLRAGEPVEWWSMSSLFRELTLGNVGLPRFVRVTTRIVLEGFGHRLGLVSTSPFRREELQARTPQLPPPVGMHPGQLVQIRKPSEVAETLNERGSNRGLWFDREMKAYCGQTARVKARVERFIDEGSGRMVELASDCYILEDVVCDSSRSNGRWFCPRAIYPWWRECWLRPLDNAGD